MPGRYQFSLPERRQRDGWFRIGTLDVTTTVLMVLIGIGSMFVYALSAQFLAKFVFFGPDVRDGEVWRLFTWPLVNPPTQFWVVLTLAFFWWLGHQVEDQVGRRRYTVLVVAMTVIPAGLVTFFNFTNETGVAYGLGILGIGMLGIIAVENPNLPVFFNIPLWVLALVYVGIDVLRLLGQRLWGQLMMELLVILVGLVGARQCGMVESLHWIPRVGGGHHKKSSSSSRPKRDRRAPASASSVVTGPWGTPASSSTDQIELDMLLDKISATGMDSLSRQEKQRLNELSKRLRGG